MDYLNDVTDVIISNDKNNFFEKKMKHIRDNFPQGNKIWILSVYNGNMNNIKTGIGENSFIENESDLFIDHINKSLSFLLNGYREIIFISPFDKVIKDESFYLSLLDDFYKSNNMCCCDNNIKDFFIFRKSLLNEYMKIKNIKTLSEDNINEIKSNAFLVNLKEYGLFDINVSFSVKTDFPIAFDSMDHIEPHGTMQDNYTSLSFIKECINKFELHGDFSVIDVGCAGGGLINDWLKYTNRAIGLEGSDYSAKSERAHWPKLYNKNLFTCDVTRDFIIYNNEDIFKADLITAWEVLEHLHTERLNIFFDNVYNHLSEGGYFIGSVHTESTVPYLGHELHVSRFEIDEWYERFIPSDKFERLEYNLTNTVREIGNKQFMIFMRKK